MGHILVNYESETGNPSEFSNSKFVVVTLEGTGLTFHWVRDLIPYRRSCLNQNFSYSKG